MLQTGMRAPMGLKVYGPDLETIERVALDFERLLKQVPSVEPAAVVADRVVGKPYLEIDIDRAAIARYGLMIRQVQDVIEVAIGGRRITTTVEGRERYPVRVRYLRELRDQIETLGRILVAAAGRHAGPAGAAGRDPLRPRSAGDQERGYVPRRLRPARQEARLSPRSTSSRTASGSSRRRSPRASSSCRPASATGSRAAMRTRSGPRRRCRSCCRWRCS